MTKGRLLQKIAVVMMAILMAVMPVSSVYAASSQQIHCENGVPVGSTMSMYANDNILFYNPCDNYCGAGSIAGGNTTYISDGNEHGHWGGGCSPVGSYNEFLNKYVDSIRTAAAKNGVPWEAMISQIIIESAGATKEVCKNNPLGLKGSPNCDGKHREFNSHEEAFDYYFKSIIPVKKSAGKFSQNPFSYIEFIEYDDPNAVYATDPAYVTKVSNVICGVQKWALENGYSISAENFSNYQSEYITNRPDGTADSSSSSSSDSSSNSSSSSSSSCFSYDGSGLPRDNGDIVATALSLGWPVSERRNHKIDDPSPAYRAAMQSLGIWMNANGTNYADNCTKVGASCDVFVSVVMRYSGADPNFPLYLGNQKTYLAQHSELYDAYPAGSVDPMPGDIRIENGNGHIVLIVRKNDGSLGIASASHCDRTGDINNYYSAPGGTIYRLKTRKNESS